MFTETYPTPFTIFRVHILFETGSICECDEIALEGHARIDYGAEDNVLSQEQVQPGLVPLFIACPFS
jgi:hypothetical protein